MNLKFPHRDHAGKHEVTDDDEYEGGQGPAGHGAGSPDEIIHDRLESPEHPVNDGVIDDPMGTIR